MARQPGVPIIPITVGTTAGINPIKFMMLMQGPTKKITEVHWYATASSLDNATLAATFQALAVARSAMLPVECNMLQWTASQENVFRDALHDDGVGFGPQVVTSNENQGNDTLPVYMQAGVQYRRTMYLGCVPDTIMNNDVYVPNNDLPYKGAIISYLALLTGSNPGLAPGGTQPPANTGWGFCPQLIDAATVPISTIFSLGFTAGLNTFTVVPTDAMTLAPGDLVAISKVPGVTQQFPMNQRWVVQNYAGGVVTLQGFTPVNPLPAQYPVTGGFIKKLVRKFQLYTNYAIGQPSSRNRGSATQTPKGRKKRKYNIGYPG